MSSRIVEGPGRAAPVRWVAPRRGPAWGAFAARLAAAAAVLFAASIVLSTLAIVVLAHRAVPKLDEWDSYALYERILRGKGLLAGLFELHNEHRILFPRLILFSDYLFFGGRGWLDLGAIFAVQAAAVGLFVWLAARAGAKGAARWALGAAAAALLFSLRQGENFTWGFQVQFVGVFACASLCCTLFALGLDAERRGRRRGSLLAAALALAAVDAFTMANGLVAAPVLAVMAVVGRARRPAALAPVVLAVALLAIYAIGSTAGENHPPAAALLRAAPAELAFMAGYLGNFSPFGQASEVAFGGFGLLALAGLAALVAFERGRNPARLALLGIALFAAGSAGLTALGRARSGLGNVESSRYATGAATFWIALVIAACSLPRGRIAWRAASAALALFLFWCCWQAQQWIGSATLAQSGAYGAFEDALLLGLLDAPALRDLDEPVDSVRAAAPLLRERGLSIFGSPDAARVGRPLAEVERPGAAPLACSGSFDAARVDPALGPDGVAAAGTTGLRSRFGSPVRVYLVDGASRIVGLAQTGFADGSWTGYARATLGSGLSAYAISGAGRLCRLGAATVSAAPPP